MEHRLKIRQYSSEDEAGTVALWQAAELLRPWNNPQADIQRKLSTDPENFLVGVDNGRIVGSIMGGYDGHRGWINYLAVLPEYRQQGVARQLMDEIETRLLRLGCPKINLQIRADNSAAIGFYQRIGYQEDKVLSFGKRLIADD